MSIVTGWLSYLSSELQYNSSISNLKESKLINFEHIYIYIYIYIYMSDLYIYIYIYSRPSLSMGSHITIFLIWRLITVANSCALLYRSLAHHGYACIGTLSNKQQATTVCLSYSVATIFIHHTHNAECTSVVIFTIFIILAPSSKIKTIWREVLRLALCLVLKFLF